MALHDFGARREVTSMAKQAQAAPIAVEFSPAENTPAGRHRRYIAHSQHRCRWRRHRLHHREMAILHAAGIKIESRHAEGCHIIAEATMPCRGRA